MKTNTNEKLLVLLLELQEKLRVISQVDSSFLSGQILRPSDVSQELGIKDPIGSAEEKVIKIAPEIVNLTKNREEFSLFQDLSAVTQEDSQYHNASEELRSLRDQFDHVVSSLTNDNTGEILPFAIEVRRSIDNLLMHIEPMRLGARLKLANVSGKMVEPLKQITQRLIGERLENEILPNLLEKSGFELQPTILPTSSGQMEFDAIAEKKTYAGAKEERLVGKEVLVVECKTTVQADDITEFAKKLNVLKYKYAEEKNVWGYAELRIEAWFVACYGWRDELRTMARENEMDPIDGQVLGRKLSDLRVYDGRIPLCPPGYDES